MINIIPVITWDGTDAISLGRTLKSVREFSVVHLWTSETYRNTHRVISNAGIRNYPMSVSIGFGRPQMNNRKLADTLKSPPQ